MGIRLDAAEVDRLVDATLSVHHAILRRHHAVPGAGVSLPGGKVSKAIGWAKPDSHSDRVGYQVVPPATAPPTSTLHTLTVTASRPDGSSTVTPSGPASATPARHAPGGQHGKHHHATHPSATQGPTGVQDPDGSSSGGPAIDAPQTAWSHGSPAATAGTPSPTHSPARQQPPGPTGGNVGARMTGHDTAAAHIRAGRRTRGSAPGGAAGRRTPGGTALSPQQQRQQQQQGPPLRNTPLLGTDSRFAS
ncbi:MAG: hypothetical protein WDW36_005599 [Sanguina aurantia]